ncbi:NAD(P)/FAD-dependent oxidoreductase [Plasticicumulans acidivorans]|uniref:Gamma-glutamylputrescine oxidase n=1 Tax=Plasticicumulans acidivorans TaxID=886464 RepID=A0A317MWK9_9GAMM|nr:FAD-binding oxidoreductase [Plasticicumulans acidivorans]PWV62350.1 gamma-glutamylputrescine oxidase [Plasticicumulans acidivorans]
MNPPQHVASWYADSVADWHAGPALCGTVRADVAVVGAGITGLSAALELARRGYCVHVVEGMRVGFGGSGRSGGQVLADYACGMELLRHQLGLDAAQQLWAMSIEAVDIVRDNIRRYGIDCDWRDGCATLALKPRQQHALAAWQETLARDYGYSATRLLSGAALAELIASPRYCAALLDEGGAGHLHPLKYTQGLARAALAAGVTLHEGSPVTHLDTGPQRRVHTAQGQIEAEHIVLAGGAWLGRLAPTLARKIMPVGTYIVATEPLGAERAAALLPGDAAVCDANFVLDYFCRSADHRLLFGGRVSYSGLEPPRLAAGMQRRLQQVFPQLGRVAVTHAWGGNVDITVNRAPHFGRLGSHVWYAQGFSGHGMALTNLAGRVLAEAIAGQNERLDLFARIPHRDFPGGTALRTPLLVLAMLWFRLRDWL